MIFPLVSVLMPVFNNVSYMDRAIKSILKQSYHLVELVIVDDGSNDGSQEVAQWYKSQYPERIKYIKTQHLGPMGARVAGLVHCSGDYIAFMDSDDVAPIHRIKRQINLLQLLNADVCGGHALVFGVGFIKFWKYPADNIGISTLLLFNSPLPMPGAMCTKVLLDKILSGDFPPVSGDYKLWSDAYMSGAKFCAVDSLVVYYRSHLSQLSNSKKELQAKHRSDIAKKNWEKLIGVNPRIESFYSLSSMKEVFEIIYLMRLAMSKGYSLEVMKSQVWKMVIRSNFVGFSRIDALHILRKANISFGFYRSIIFLLAIVFRYFPK